MNMILTSGESTKTINISISKSELKLAYRYSAFPKIVFNHNKNMKQNLFLLGTSKEEKICTVARELALEVIKQLRF